MSLPATVTAVAPTSVYGSEPGPILRGVQVAPTV
jgi:hypothetical protein